MPSTWVAWVFARNEFHCGHKVNEMDWNWRDASVGQGDRGGWWQVTVPRAVVRLGCNAGFFGNARDYMVLGGVLLHV